LCLTSETLKREAIEYDNGNPGTKGSGSTQGKRYSGQYDKRHGRGSGSTAGGSTTGGSTTGGSGSTTGGSGSGSTTGDTNHNRSTPGLRSWQARSMV
jgi:hypothetical protein